MDTRGRERTRKDAPEATQRQPATATEQQPRAQHRRGIRCFERPDRPAPYCVQYRVNGVRKTESFAKADDRDRRAQGLVEAAGKNVLSEVPTRAEILDFRAFKAALGSDDWRDLVALWRARDGNRNGTQTATATVDQLVERYLASQQAKLGAQKLAPVSERRHRVAAEKFLADFRGLPVERVTPEELTEWLESTGESNHTFNSYLRVLRAIWSAGGLPQGAPKQVFLRDETPDEVAILTVEQAKKLFAYGAKHRPSLMPRIAAEAFLGLRFSSAMRLARSDVNVTDRGVLLPAKKLKTGRRHYIDQLPENFFRWFALETPETWALTERLYLRDKSALFTDAKVPHPHNCLRHSACSYHVAAYKNAGKTAAMLCQTDQDMLWKFYNGRATQADGLAYFAITP